MKSNPKWMVNAENPRQFYTGEGFTLDKSYFKLAGKSGRREIIYSPPD